MLKLTLTLSVINRCKFLYFSINSRVQVTKITVYSTSIITTIPSNLEEYIKMCVNIKTKKFQPDVGDRPDLIQTVSVPSTGLARQTNNLSNISRVQVTKKEKTKKCQPDAGDRPDLIQTATVPSTGLARQTNYLSNITRVQVTKNIKTIKCQPDAGDRPDLIQTATVPSTGLARQTNYLSHITRVQVTNVKSNDQVLNLSVASKLSTRRINQSKEINSPDSLSVANKVSEDTVKQPDDKWLTVVLTKTKKCQPDPGDRPDLIQTESVPRIGLARQNNKNKRNEKYKNKKSNYLQNVTLVEDTKHSQVIPFILSTVHTVHTLEPRVTDLVNVRPAQTCHTLAPRVTDLVTVGESLLSILQQSLFWSLTVAVAVVEVIKLTKWYKQSHETVVIPFILSTVHTVHTLEPRVTVLVNVRPAQTCHTLAPRVTDLVTVGESLLSILQQSLFWSLTAAVAVRPAQTCHTLVEVVKLSNQLFWSLTEAVQAQSSQVTVVIPFILSTVHTVHTLDPRVTVLVNVRPAQTCHTLVPRVTDLVPVGESLLCILQQSLFWSLTAVVAVVEVVKSILNTQVSSLKSQVTVPRSLSCGHRLMVIPNTFSYSHSISRKQRNKAIKQQNGNGKNTISVCHWNLGSKKWKNKRNQIQALVDLNQADLIFISEANLDETTAQYESMIQGYTITFPKTVVINCTARLVLLTKNGLNFTIRDDLMTDTFSSIWVKISRQGIKSLLVCGVYREHQYLNQETDWSLQPAEQIKRWQQFLRQVETARSSSVCHLIGDFNLDYKKWNSPDHLQLQMITDSKNCLEAGGFFQLVSEVTRSWPGQLDSLIDHFWTNDVQKILEVKNTVRSVADHNVITATIRMKGSESKRLDSSRRSFKNFDPTVFRQILGEENWNEIYEITDVDLANDFLESRVVAALDTLCPYRTIQHRRETKPWLTTETKDLMIARDQKRELARTNNDQESWKDYRACRNKVNREVDKDRHKHYDDIYKQHFDNKDVSALYKTAKTQAGWVKNTSPTAFTVQGQKITNPQQMADVQMETFAVKTKKLLDNLPPATTDPCSLLVDSLNKWGPRKDAREVFNFHTITKLDTLKILKDLNNTTSSANDRLESTALKHAAAILHGPITHIVNTSITTSKFAAKWKIGKLLPLHKGKGLNPQDPTSYRPISLLPALGKIVERVLQPQILEFMEHSGQFNNNIHSYRKSHSTTTAMIQLSDKIFRGCDAKQITTLITLDQSAAFDVLRHSTLIEKLRLYNFSDTVIKWVESYLNFRSQYVNIGTRNSKFSNVNSGVPQGSVLGPIFYVIYVNELPAITNDDNCPEVTHRVEGDAGLFTENCNSCGQIPTYADDSTIVITTDTRFKAQERIITLVDRVKIFLASNSLSLNIGKTEIVEVMVRQKRARIGGVPPQLTVVNPDNTIKVITAKGILSTTRWQYKP